MKLKSSIAIAAALFALGTIVAIGCNAPKTDTSGQTAAPKDEKPVADTHAPGEHKDDAVAPVGTQEDLGSLVAYTNEKGELVCPVLGDVIPSADKAAGHQDYKGKRYYFCCAGCPETFAKDPDKYAK